MTSLVIQLLIIGTLQGGIYALAAFGLSLIFGVSNVLNLAHGEFLMLGGLFSYILFMTTKWNPMFLFLILIPFFFGMGFFFERGLIRPLSKKKGHELAIASILVTLGASLAIEDITSFFWGPEEKGISYIMPSMNIGDMVISSIRLLGLLFIILLLILFPYVTPRYMTAFLLLLLMHIVIAESYDIMGGYLGYVNLGHSAFFGLGAYAFAILLNAKFGFFISSLAAVLVGVAFAALISFPFFRLRGAYFSLTTFGLIRLLELLAFNLKSLTGGSSGIMIAAEYRLTMAYYFTLGLCVVTIGLVSLLTRSRFGLAWVVIREDEEAARSFGINTFKHKCVALMISASFASLMGAFYTWYIIFINPKVVFGLEITLVPIAMAMLAGSGATLGPMVGAFFITIVEEFLWTKVPYFRLAAYGTAIVLVGLFMPGGIVRLKWFRKPLTYLGFLED